MLKFFIKIRQYLIYEGKTVKHFKYAFGEILLIVIGILVALLINNLNDARKQIKKERELLQKFIVFHISWQELSMTIFMYKLIPVIDVTMYNNQQPLN